MVPKQLFQRTSLSLGQSGKSEAAATPPNSAIMTKQIFMGTYFISTS
jgi:hypothetical protein